MYDHVKTLTDVVSNGYCVGCGACAVGSDSKNAMTLNSYGSYLPSVNIQKNDASEVCPFSVNSPDEDSIADKLFNVEKNTEYLNGLGYYRKTFAGYVSSGEFRKNGSSGGMGSWLVSELLEKNIVDAILHVRAIPDNDVMFEYVISHNIEDAKSAAKSKYYPITLNEVVDEVLSGGPKRYAVVGLPCFIKSLRLLENKHSVLKERLLVHIGIVCGHLKSTSFSELLAWQQGVQPQELKYVDFRRKLKYRGASTYAFESKSKTNKRTVTPMPDLYGGDWGEGLFKLKSCEFCDDVMAETADVVIGDAWLANYRNDSKGTNVVATRSELIDGLIIEAINEGRLKFDKIEPTEVIKSQSSGIRHRREGLQYRLAKELSLGKLVPKKRVEPNLNGTSDFRKNIYTKREILRHTSHEAFLMAKCSDDFEVFSSVMKPLSKNYQITLAGSKNKYFLNKVKLKLIRIIRVITRTNNVEVYK